ncbi:MAG: TonB-dependent receptor [Bacteroidales bacterium]|nr:TonB-dependent receptor [Bacteroidales bacterium]
MKYITFILIFILSVSTLSAQTYTMEGVVKDELGPLAGATVLIKNKATMGTITDNDGKFSIKADRGDMLVFSYVGMKKVEYLVTEQKKNLEIMMTEPGEQLEEVVVTALGKQRKISSIAAVTSVEVKDLQQPASSVANLLGGRVAGVISIMSSGEPGKNIADFWVRGIGTFGANSSALVLIDGLEGDINALDPADIESFSILKDASATAVYGVRGANGVVLVTTKRGQADKLKITARASMSVSTLHRLPDYLGAYDYALLANEARAVRGEDPLYSNIELDIIKDGTDRDIYPDVNWQDEIIRNTSLKQNYYVSAQGGAEVARYFLSLGGSNETAAYNVDNNSPYSSNAGYNTYNFRANVDINLTKSTKVYFGTDGFMSIHNEPGVANTDYIWQAQSQINPLRLPTVYSNGQYPSTGAQAEVSPYVMINMMGRRSSQKYSGKTTLALEQDLSMFLDGLKVKIQGAYDISSYFDERRYISPALYEAVGRSQQGELITIQRSQSTAASYGNSTNQYRKYHFEGTLNYDKVFNEDHRFSALVYYYMSDEKTASESTTNMNSIPLRYQGVSSRLTYGYKDTYMLDFNFGYTGSENFQPGRRFGFFPSIALGWVPTNYALIRDNLPFLNFLKFRGSYGTVGNDRISDYRFPYLTIVNRGSVSPFGSSSTESLVESYTGADNLIWEKSTKADLGIEARLFNEKVSFVVDFFNDKRDGIFQRRVQVPSYVGLISMPYSNVGKMNSYGADGNVSYTYDFSKDLSVTLRGNFTYSKNNVQNWEEANPKYPYQEASGYPYGVVRGYQSIGLFKDEKDIETSPVQTFGTVMPGDIKYRDVNGDGIINSDDRVPISYSQYPLLMYGFGTEIRYQNVSLGVLFKGTGKTDYFHQGMGYVPFYEGKSGNVLTQANEYSNRWIPMEYALANGIDPSLAENPNAMYPRLQYGYNSNNSQTSDFWKGDARYLRLQEVTLNYNLRKPFLSNIGITSIDFQLVGNNLCVWDKVKLFDPEQANQNGRVYPIPTTYTLQLYVHF